MMMMMILVLSRGA